MSSQGSLLKAASAVVWGEGPKEELFARWCQGFEFSEDEPLALLQYSGGPCSVLAPVQALLLQKYLFEGKHKQSLETDEWRKCSAALAQHLLLQTMADILLRSSSSDSVALAVLSNKTLNRWPTPAKAALQPQTQSQSQSQSQTQSQSQAQSQTQTHSQPQSHVTTVGSSGGEGGSAGDEIPHDPGNGDPSLASSGSVDIGAAQKASGPRTDTQSLPEGGRGVSSVDQAPSRKSDSGLSGGLEGVAGVGTSSPRGDAEQGSEEGYGAHFHEGVSVVRCRGREELSKQLANNFADFEGPFGVPLFLYSTVMTKGTEELQSELEDCSEPLIEGTHGHGSQSLVNLLLTGKAVTNVFDSDRDLGGVKLKGIPVQCCVGFLTVLEALKYCGDILKSPLSPVWVVGSETHLTVIFSTTSGLVSPESPETVARREFAKLDPEGSGMVPIDSLGKLMTSLEMFADSDYVQYMAKKVDPDSLGVILLTNFIEEFFPNKSSEDSCPHEFTLYHCNGLVRASHKVCFQKGTAVLGEQLPQLTSDPTLLNCLRTKWPSLSVQWEGGLAPSIT